jgi:toxin FitB
MGISKLRDGKKKLSLQKWVDEDLSRRFIGRILRIDQEVASRWGIISGQAERDGKKIPVIDGLLAATAIEGGLILITRDVGHVQGTGVTILDPWGL